MTLTREPTCMSGVGGGWEVVVQRTDILLSAIDPDYSLDQYKEKFGGLRFYFTPSNSDYDSAEYEAMQKIVDDAEAECSTLCEACGQPGTLRTEEYWIRTECDECNDERRKRMTASKEEYEDE